jgi:hypothetical protein
MKDERELKQMIIYQSSLYMSIGRPRNGNVRTEEANLNSWRKKKEKKLNDPFSPSRSSDTESASALEADLEVQGLFYILISLTEGHAVA